MLTVGKFSVQVAEVGKKGDAVIWLGHDLP